MLQFRHYGAYFITTVESWKFSVQDQCRSDSCQILMRIGLMNRSGAFSICGKWKGKIVFSKQSVSLKGILRLKTRTCPGLESCIYVETTRPKGLRPFGDRSEYLYSTIYSLMLWYSHTSIMIRCGVRWFLGFTTTPSCRQVRQGCYNDLLVRLLQRSVRRFYAVDQYKKSKRRGPLIVQRVVRRPPAIYVFSSQVFIAGTCVPRDFLLR